MRFKRLAIKGYKSFRYLTEILFPTSQNGKSIFLIGGPGARNLPGSRLYESGYSIICYGEGERTIVELSTHGSRLAGHPGAHPALRVEPRSAAAGRRQRGRRSGR